MLSSELVSRPYVRMTAAIMEHFGVPGVEIRDRIIVVPPGRYSAQHFTVEPDASSAGYPLAAAAICAGRATVPGLTEDSIQGDAGFCHVLARMGCTVTQDSEATTVTRSGPLRGLAINMAEMSDLVPTLAAVAAFADGATEIHGVGFPSSEITPEHIYLSRRQFMTGAAALSATALLAACGSNNTRSNNSGNAAATPVAPGPVSATTDRTGG